MPLASPSLVHATRIHAEIFGKTCITICAVVTAACEYLLICSGGETDFAFLAAGLSGAAAAGLFITDTAFQGEMSRITVRHSVRMHVWGRL